MKRSGFDKVLALAFGLLVLMPPISLWGEVRHPGPVVGSEVKRFASPANVEQYFRDRFQIPESTNVISQPLRPADVPHFYQTVVTVNDGKEGRDFNAFITDDARCLALGSVFALNGASNADIIRCVRQAASLPPAAHLTIGPFTKTRLQGFLRSTVTIELGTKTEKGDLFVAEDRRVGVLGLLLPFRRDFVEQLIDTSDQPSLGAAHAPVTIVEYADLECPVCAQFQKFLETEFLPKYNSRVRIIFKEFPLPFHTWSMTAALANECAFQIDPDTFSGYRSMIFGNQTSISASNVHDRLLSMAEDAGLNRGRQTACLDSKAARGRVEASRLEAEMLGVNATPTFAINGRVVRGTPSPAAFCKMIDEALEAAGK
jgi:protein-disulfide isomerase